MTNEELNKQLLEKVGPVILKQKEGANLLAALADRLGSQRIQIEQLELAVANLKAALAQARAEYIKEDFDGTREVPK